MMPPFPSSLGVGSGEGRAGFMGTCLRVLNLEGPMIGFILCCCYLQLFNNFLNKELGKLCSWFWVELIYGCLLLRTLYRL